MPGQYSAAALPAAGGISAAAAPLLPPTPAAFRASPLSAYTTVQQSIKGGVGVPTGSDLWLQKQVRLCVCVCVLCHRGAP
jgi:hypothetical protein